MGSRFRPPTTVAVLACILLAAAAPVSAAAGPAASRGAVAHRSHVRPGARCSTRARRAAPRRARRKHGCKASQRHRKHAAVHPLSAVQTPSPAQEQAQARAATVAAVLATTCQNTQLTPEAGNVELLRTAVLCLINQERAQHGVQPLALSRRLESAAESHCGELIVDDYFAHVSPAGETPVDRVRATGYIPGPNSGYVIGENLAWGTYSLATPQAIVAAWAASPGHLANILESQYTETGIGVTPAVPTSLGGGAQGATYAQEFGVITG